MNQEREDAVLDAVVEHWKRYYSPPSIRALCRATGIESTSLMRLYLDALVDGGRLVYGGKPRKPVPPFVKAAIDGKGPDPAKRAGDDWLQRQRKRRASILRTRVKPDEVEQYIEAARRRMGDGG